MYYVKREMTSCFLWDSSPSSYSKNFCSMACCCPCHPLVAWSSITVHTGPLEHVHLTLKLLLVVFRKGRERKQQKKGSDSSRKTHSKNIRKNRKNIAQDAWDVQAHKCHKSMPKQICLIFRDQSNISTGEKHWILLQAWGSREDKWQEGRPVTMTTFPFLVPDNRDDSCQHRPYSHCLHFLFLRRALHQQSYTAM